MDLDEWIFTLFKEFTSELNGERTTDPERIKEHVQAFGCFYLSEKGMNIETANSNIHLMSCSWALTLYKES